MTTKEELDEAIKYIDEYCGNAPEILTALTILTKYRDGELVEKQPIKYFQIMGKDTIFTTDLLPTPPTNQTQPTEPTEIEPDWLIRSLPEPTNQTENP